MDCGIASGPICSPSLGLRLPRGFWYALKSAFMARDAVAVKRFFKGFLDGRYGRPDPLTIRNISVLVDGVIETDTERRISDVRAETFFRSFA